MTTLDNLIRFVEELESRSLLLVDAVEESTRLMSKMMGLSALSNEKDMAIEQMESHVDSNAMFLDLVENLMEKTYLLESSMDVDNQITTTTTLANLQTEYTYLKTKFTMDNGGLNTTTTTNDSTSVCDSVPRTRSSVYTDNKRLSSIYGASDAITHMLDYQFHSHENDTQETEPRKSLSHQISVSNLSLKPLRCSNNARIEKKKSKYRVSKVYNINPVAYDSVSSVFEDESCSSIHITPEQKPKNCDFLSQEYNMFNPPPVARPPPGPRRLFSNATDTTLPSTAESSAVNNIMLHHENDGIESEATEDIAFTYFDNHLHLKHKSNSLPDMGHNNNINNDGELGLFIDLHKGPDTRNMRNSRLKHFMSYNHLASAGGGYETSSEDVEHNLNIENTDHLDELSMVSDFSFYSPDKQQQDSMAFDEDVGEVVEEEDNFNRFLRKSRLDLNKVLPPIKRCHSHDSIFHVPDEKQHVPAVDTNTKFHNPIDTMAMSTKAKRLSPTIETVYSSSLKTNDITNSQHNSKTLLEKYSRTISNDNDDDDKNWHESDGGIDSSPLKHKASTSSFTFFNLVSPSKAKAKSIPSRSKAQGPTLSLKETFCILVNSKSSTTSSAVDTPPKIKSLKDQYRSKTKTKPIQIRSGSSVQRQPVRHPRTDGAHSLLSIGPNGSTVITHGDASYFKRPVVTRFDPEMLRDALSRSIE